MQQFNQVTIILSILFDDEKLVIIRLPKSIRFELTKKIDNNLKFEVNHIIKHNEFLAEENKQN